MLELCQLIRQTWLVAGSLNIILKGDHLRNILPKFDVGSLGWRAESSDIVLQREPCKDHSFNWPSSFRGYDFETLFPIGFYVKTMSAILVGPAGSSDTILKGDHSRTISPKFDPQLAK